MGKGLLPRAHPHWECRQEIGSYILLFFFLHARTPTVLFRFGTDIPMWFFDPYVLYGTCVGMRAPFKV